MGTGNELRWVRRHAAGRQLPGVLLLGLCLLLPSPAALAVGFGGLLSLSPIGRPLDVMFPLFVDEPAKDAAQLLHVTIASDEAYTALGIPRPDLLNAASITLEPSGAVVLVHVRTRHGVAEPYLPLIVDLMLPSGVLRHRYDLLLDPVVDDAAAPPAWRQAPDTVSAPAVSLPAPTPRWPAAKSPAAANRKHQPAAVATGDGGAAAGTASQTDSGLNTPMPQTAAAAAETAPTPAAPGPAAATASASSAVDSTAPPQPEPAAAAPAPAEPAPSSPAPSSPAPSAPAPSIPGPAADNSSPYLWAAVIGALLLLGGLWLAWRSAAARRRQAFAQANQDHAIAQYIASSGSTSGVRARSAAPPTRPPAPPA